MVSYTRARAEGLGVECQVGWMQRPERMTLFIIGSLLASIPMVGDVIMKLTLLVLAVLSNFTALQRMYHVRRQLLSKANDQVEDQAEEKHGEPAKNYRNPIPTVDVIIQMENDSIVLIQRKNPPYGWALPGGFVDYGESVEDAAVREAQEETSLKIELLYQFGTYSAPDRDPRHHTITVVFVARANGIPKAADDAKDIGVFGPDSVPEILAFDHGKILKDYFEKCCQKS
jgi:ADP-ribose pyrophosphatase YjhB (NUDIX family)